MSLANLSVSFERMRYERDLAIRERWLASPCTCIGEGWIDSNGGAGSRIVAECARCFTLKRLADPTTGDT